MRKVTSLQIAKARIRSMRNSGKYSEGDYLDFLELAKDGIKQGYDNPAGRGMAPIFKPMGERNECK